MNSSRAASILVVLIALVYILIIGQSLIIPIVFAILLWILVRELKEVMDRVKFFRERFPSWLKSVISTLALMLTIGMISNILIRSIKNLASSYKEYEANVVIMTQKGNDLFGIDINDLVRDQLNEFNFGKLFGAVLNSMTDILGSTFMILIYALFIFMEEANFQKKMEVIFNRKEQYDRFVQVLNRMESSITQYLGLKVIVSLITGVCSYIALAIIGIESPVFWAFLIFLLNFIPTIGSLIATVFPVAFSLLQFGDFMPGLWVLIFVGAIQIIVGNLIEPKLMGNSLNISSLVAIMALVFWGALWGVTGMLMSVPITVIIVIILSQFEKTKNLAVLLSKDGRIMKN